MSEGETQDFGELIGVLMLDNAVLGYEGKSGDPFLAFDNDLTEEQAAILDKWIEDLVANENNRANAAPQS